MMAYSAAAIVALASQCAPTVAPETVLAIVQTESNGEPFALNVNGGRQAVALRGVEHYEAFEERNRTGFTFRAFSLLVPIFGRETVGVKDRLPALALANASASGQRLPEGQPILRRVTALNDRAPKNENIDARIGTPRHRVARQPHPFLA